MRRFSRTVSSGKISVIWKVRAMPQPTRARGQQRGDVLVRRSTMRPAVGAKKPLIRLKNVVLPAPFGPITARSSPGSTVIETSSTATRLPKCLVTLLDLEQAHARAFRWSMPSTPRGKNSTTSTNSRPTNDIQLTVMARNVVLQHDEHGGAEQRAPEACACRPSPP